MDKSWGHGKVFHGVFGKEGEKILNFFLKVPVLFGSHLSTISEFWNHSFFISYS